MVSGELHVWVITDLYLIDFVWQTMGGDMLTPGVFCSVAFTMRELTDPRKEIVPERFQAGPLCQKIQHSTPCDVDVRVQEFSCQVGVRIPTQSWTLGRFNAFSSIQSPYLHSRDMFKSSSSSSSPEGSTKTSDFVALSIPYSCAPEPHTKSLTAS